MFAVRNKVFPEKFLAHPGTFDFGTSKGAHLFETEAEARREIPPDRETWRAVVEVRWCVVWRVEGHEDDWLAPAGDWVREKTERELFDSRAKAHEARPWIRLGHRISTKVVRVLRKVA